MFTQQDLQPRQLTWHEVHEAFGLRTAQLSSPSTRWAVLNVETGEILTGLLTELSARARHRQMVDPVCRNAKGAMSCM
jgi:hypothetical protein